MTLKTLSGVALMMMVCWAPGIESPSKYEMGRIICMVMFVQYRSLSIVSCRLDNPTVSSNPLRSILFRASRIEVLRHESLPLGASRVLTLHLAALLENDRC